jgi:hypothetical protein
LFGEYENFPKNIQGIALFEYHEAIKNVQKAILFTFYKINQEIYKLSDVASYLDQNCEVGFEFGVAESSNFIFLDKKELERCVKFLSEKDFGSLDFLFIVRYYRIKVDSKKVPLKFDFQIIRFIFKRDFLELQIHHEKGPQHIPIDDLTKFMAKKINSELVHQELLPLIIGDFLKFGLK